MRNRDANYDALISQHILNYVNRVLQFRLKLEGLSKEKTGERLLPNASVSFLQINCTLSLIFNCVLNFLRSVLFYLFSDSI